MKQRRHTIMRHMQNRRLLLRIIAANGSVAQAHAASDRQGGTEPHAAKPRQQSAQHAVKKPASAHTGHHAKSTGNTAAISQAEIEQAMLNALASGAIHNALIDLIHVQIQEYQRIEAVYSQTPGSYQRPGGF